MTTHGISSPIFGPARLPPTAELLEFRANVRSLIDAIDKGDLEAAKAAYAKIVEADAGKAEEDEEAQSPFDRLLAALGEALEAGDIDAAQKALDEYKASRLADPPRAIVRQHPSFLSEDARHAFISLIDAIQSDELADAKDALATLLDLTAANEAASASPFDRFLQEVGAALAADDLDSAKAALAELAQHRPNGGAVDVTA